MSFKLKAPTHRGGYAIDKNFIKQETTYYEIVQVKNGIAVCENAMTRDILIRRGYTEVTGETEDVKPETEEKNFNLKPEGGKPEGKRIKPRK